MSALDVLNITIWVCILLSVWVLFVVLRCKQSYSQTMMAVLSVSIIFMCIGYLMEMAGTTLEGAVNGVALEFIGSNLAMLFYILFIAAWCEVKLPNWIKAILIIETFAACALSFPGPYQYLYYSPTAFLSDGIVPTLAIEYGVFGDVNNVVTVCLFVMVIVVGVRAWLRRNSKDARSTLVLFSLAALIPFVVSLLYSAGLFGEYDPAPIGYAIALPLLTYCIVKRRAFDALPGAFESIVANMNEIVVVRDDHASLLFANQAAKDQWGALKIATPVPDEIWSIFEKGEFPLEERFYQATVTPLLDDGESRGSIATATDITSLKRINDLLEAERKRVGRDLALAATIQASALPRVFPPWPDRTDFDIFAAMRPAKEVGGDFYDFFLVDHDHLGIVIADVSGKGMPAALFMMMAKTYIKDHMMNGDLPDQALTLANNQLREVNDAGMFVTVWALLVDLRDGHAVFTNAGHNPPLLKRCGQADWEYLKSRPNMVLGSRDGLTYRLNDLQLDEGDMDSPTALIPLIQESIDAFKGKADQYDDITMLSLRINRLDGLGE